MKTHVESPGERCPDYHPDCAVCTGWDFFDITGQHQVFDENYDLTVDNVLIMRRVMDTTPMLLRDPRVINWVRVHQDLFTSPEYTAYKLNQTTDQ
jgi:hypothetical protein